MSTSISRRAVILVACLAGIAWAGLAQAAPVSFTAEISGAQQVPPVQTSATGKADLTYDPSTRVVTWTITCEGLSGPVTMAHFHVAQAGKNGPVAIWSAKAAAGRTAQSLELCLLQLPAPMTLRFNMMIEMPVNLGGCRKIRLSRQEHRATKHLQTRPTSIANAIGELTRLGRCRYSLRCSQYCGRKGARRVK